MTFEHDKAKRWRPRFSVRTLVIVVTLVCVYFGLWEATKQRGVHEVHVYSSELQGVPLEMAGLHEVPDCIMPLLVGNEELRDGRQYQELRRCYYFWFFGYVAKFPYEPIVDEFGTCELPGSSSPLPNH